MTTAEQFRKECEVDKQQSKNLVAQYQDKIDRHNNPYQDIQRHIMMEDSEIPKTVVWAWWDIQTSKATKIILMPIG